MIDQLESQLRAVFAERADEVPAEAGARLRQIDYRPRSFGARPRVAIGAGAGVAATTGAVVSLIGLGAGTPAAFAGWRSTPTPPTSGETAGAVSACTSRLAGQPGPFASIPASAWQPSIVDTRGPFTAVIMHTGDATASCFSGPTFTSVSGHSGSAGSGQQMGFASSSVSGFSGGGGAAGGGSSGSGEASFQASGEASSQTSGLGAPGAAVVMASSSHLTDRDGQPFTLVEGQVASDVTAVTLNRSDGTDVQATTANGSFLAWWPGTAGATTATVTTASGTTTVQLPGPPSVGAVVTCTATSAAPCSGSSSSRSSGSADARVLTIHR